MDHALITSALSELLTHLKLEFADIRVRAENDFLRVEIDSPQANRIIGWHGETLNALQHVLKSMIRTMAKLDRAPFLILDVDGYRASQEEKVKKIALSKADFVRRTGNRIALSPMSPYFRRIVHLYIAAQPDLQDLTTESVGDGDYRQVVLRMKEEKKQPAHGSEELSPVFAADDGLENLDI